MPELYLSFMYFKKPHQGAVLKLSCLGLTDALLSKQSARGKFKKNHSGCRVCSIVNMICIWIKNNHHQLAPKSGKDSHGVSTLALTVAMADS